MTLLSLGVYGLEEEKVLGFGKEKQPGLVGWNVLSLMENFVGMRIRVNYLSDWVGVKAW